MAAKVLGSLIHIPVAGNKETFLLSTFNYSLKNLRKYLSRKSLLSKPTLAFHWPELTHVLIP